MRSTTACKGPARPGRGAEHPDRDAQFTCVQYTGGASRPVDDVDSGAMPPPVDDRTHSIRLLGRASRRHPPPVCGLADGFGVGCSLGRLCLLLDPPTRAFLAASIRPAQGRSNERAQPSALALAGTLVVLGRYKAVRRRDREPEPLADSILRRPRAGGSPTRLLVHSIIVTVLAGLCHGLLSATSSTTRSPGKATVEGLKAPHH